MRSRSAESRDEIVLEEPLSLIFEFQLSNSFHREKSKKKISINLETYIGSIPIKKQVEESLKLIAIC